MLKNEEPNFDEGWWDNDWWDDDDDDKKESSGTELSTILGDWVKDMEDDIKRM